MGRFDNHSGHAAKPGCRDDNTRSTLPENPNSRSLSDKLTSGRSSGKLPQLAKGASLKQAGPDNHGGRPDDTFDNGPDDSTGRILDRANSNSVDTEVIETIAPGKFSSDLSCLGRR